MCCAKPHTPRATARLFGSVLAVALSLAAPCATARAQTTAPVVDTMVARALATTIRQGEYRPLRWPKFPELTSTLTEVYVGAQWTPLWSRDDHPTPAARRMLSALQGIRARGLDPRDYDVGRLSALVDSGLLTTAQRVSFDVTMSVAALRVLHTLRFGRLDATAAHAHLRLPKDTVDFQAEFRALLSDSAPEARLNAAEPPYVHYALLKQALLVYEERARTDTAALRMVAKIRLTLERWRWLPHQFNTSPIIVNIPAFRLYALSTNSDRESDMLRMDVVVGRAYDQRTPVFSDALEHIVFAPYWDVPPSIAKKELIPIARRDPRYLTANRYQVLDMAGRILPPTAAALRAVGDGTARIRQLPGPGNALGLVKFVFPNAFNVYMHDTPAKKAFERARRDISHGCIRLANPFALAQRLLQAVPGWDSTAIVTAMHEGSPRRVDLPRPVPVHIIYATAVAREDGTMLFFDDIYALDAALERQLARGYPYRRQSP